MMAALAEMPRPIMREYRCRYCGWWLVTTDAAEGRAELTCGNRRCGRRQMVRFIAAENGPRLTERETKG